MLWTVKLKNYSKHIMNNLVQKSHGKVMIYEVALYGAHQSEKRCPYGQECLGRSVWAGVSWAGVSWAGFAIQPL